MNSKEMESFGERVRNRRKEIGITQDQIATKIGISLRFYQMIERGEKSLSLDTLIRLSKALGISIDYLVFGSVAGQLDNPVAEILNTLPPQRQEDAVKILQLYSKGTETPE